VKEWSSPLKIAFLYKIISGNLVGSTAEDFGVFLGELAGRFLGFLSMSELDWAFGVSGAGGIRLLVFIVFVNLLFVCI
jgi:hypothetical protein